MKITISGEAYSGKGTLGKLLEKELNCKYYSMGDIRREIAKKKGLTIEQLNKIGEREDWTDKLVDEYQKNILSKQNKIIVDGRMSWYLIPDSFKIFLDSTMYTSAKRKINSQRDTEKNTQDIEEAIKDLTQRKVSDIERYSKLYNINPYEFKHYDSIIKTDYMAPKEVFEKTLIDLSKSIL